MDIPPDKPTPATTFYRGLGWGLSFASVAWLAIAYVVFFAIR